MPRHTHEHANRPLGAFPNRLRGKLPANQFGGLVGTIDHLTLTPHDPQGRDNDPHGNHIYIWMEVPAGRFGGLYECAFNTESNQPGSDSQYYVHDEQIARSDLPTVGFWDAAVSYAGLGLTQADFHNITNGQLRSSIVSWAEDATLVCVYGVTYQEGDGMHEVHRNSGEPAGSEYPNRVNQDGALAFYYLDGNTAPFRRWVFIKFSTQTLG